MGKDKNLAEKGVMPSTTRGGKDLPSRPNFSPNAASAVSSRKKNATLSGSPLSELSAHIESNLSRASRDKEVTRDLSKSPSIDKVGSELDEIEYYDDCEIESEEDAIFARDYLYGGLEDLDKLDDYKNISLDDFFPAASKSNGFAIYIKDKGYEFSVDLEIIKKAKTFKFYGKSNEFPLEHMVALHELSALFGKDEIQQCYYFLKLSPFTLGGDAKNWYNSLVPCSITSQEVCLCQLFDKYLPTSKVHALTLDINNFS
jgi:hypothetical protein